MKLEKKTCILVGYARSGITVFNRSLASDSRLICLSEINSRYICPTSPNTPREQVEKWYDYKIQSDSIVNEIIEIKKRADILDKTLVVRDWSFGSFVPLKYNNYLPPLTLNTIDDIGKLLPIASICIVRNPVDVWLSMKNSVKTFHDKKLEYLFAFVRDVLNRNIIICKYEEFCTDPIRTLDKFYKYIGLESVREVNLSDHVTGDSNTPNSSRGAHLNHIRNLDRRPLNREDARFLLKETKATEIMNMLDYDQSYLGRVEATM